MVSLRLGDHGGIRGRESRPGAGCRSAGRGAGGAARGPRGVEGIVRRMESGDLLGEARQIPLAGP